MRRAGSIAVCAFVAAVAGSALAACSDDAPPGVDGGEDDAGGDDDDDDDDGGGGTAGLRFEWVAEPSPPVELDNLTIDAVHLRLRDIRAVGDASPGDDRTSRDALELDWEDGDEPEPLRFDTAPPGLYSALEFRLDGGDFEAAYVIEGEVEVEGEWFPYAIEDEVPLSIEIRLDVELEAGEVEEVEVPFHLGDALDDINWSDATLDDGTLVLEGEVLDDFRDSMEDALGEDDDGGGGGDDDSDGGA